MMWIRVQSSPVHCRNVKHNSPVQMRMNDSYWRSRLMWLSPDSWDCRSPRCPGSAAVWPPSARPSEHHTHGTTSARSHLSHTHTNTHRINHGNIPGLSHRSSSLHMHACKRKPKQKYACKYIGEKCKCVIYFINISYTHHDTEILWCIAHNFLSPRHSWKPQKPFFPLQDMNWTKEQWEW